jgi:hypothetical protein
MTDLPYGRGGSPLQNFVVRGVCETEGEPAMFRRRSARERDVSNLPEMPRDLETLKAFAWETRSFPHARSLESIEVWAVSRGASVGVETAGAFTLGERLRRDPGSQKAG